MFKKNPKIFLVIVALLLVFSFLIFANLRTGLQASVANAQSTGGMGMTATTYPVYPVELKEPLTVNQVYDFLKSQNILDRYGYSGNPQINFMSDSSTNRFFRESKALMNAFANLYTTQGTNQVEMQFKEYKNNDAAIQSNPLSQASPESVLPSIKLLP